MLRFNTRYWFDAYSKNQLAISIVEPSPVVKAMRDFVTNDATDGTKIEVPRYLVRNVKWNNKKSP